MLRCLIVDDEPPARELIASYISRLDDLVLVDQCENALRAFNVLQKNHIDLMFLDIQMPKMTGLELIKSLQNPPKVVLTTAYKEYASEGFDLDVLDYLVKPISFERFMRSIAKFHQFTPQVATETGQKETFENAYFFVKVNKEQVKIYYKDLLYIESLKDYLRVVSRDSSCITYNRLTYMEEVLPESHFVRIHKSFIISLGQLDSYGSDSVRIVEREIPVGRVYKQKFQDSLGRFQANYQL